MQRITQEIITELKENEIFVFGSNLAGIHGAGAARTACSKFGAKMGIGSGFTGKCYAIPTKDERIETLGLPLIDKFVFEFDFAALSHPELTFLVTPIGCGLAGYRPQDIAPMFRSASTLPNVFLPETFWEVLRKGGK